VKTHPVLCQLIQMRSLVEGAPVGTEVALPEVIGEKKDHVKLIRRAKRRECEDEREK